MGFLARKNPSEEGNKLTKEITILNRLGLHARPSAMFVKVCNRHKCDIWIEKDGEQVNGKSIMGLMMLAAGPGTEIDLAATGPDATRAVDALAALIACGFDES